METYPISAEAYLRRARQCLASGSSAQLFYAALEIRSGVEARLQQYLEMHDHIPLGRRQEWNVTKLHKTTEVEFKIRDQVARLQLSDPNRREVPFLTLYYTPVTSRLRKLAESFGNYLHAAKQFHEATDVYWSTLRGELEEAAALLEDTTFGTLMGPMLMKADRKDVNMKIQVLKDTPLPDLDLSMLKGITIAVNVRYFPNLRSARDAT